MRRNQRGYQRGSGSRDQRRDPVIGSGSIGVDVGGTFTDVVLLRQKADTWALHWLKVPSTPADPAIGVLNGVQEALREVQGSLPSVWSIRHGSTVGTNAVLERKGAKTAIVTTGGFEDTLEIGRQARSEMYSLFLRPETPVFIAPRDQRFGIAERMDSEGEVLKALDADDVQDLAVTLAALGIESVAVCYLFSYKNTAHERETRDLLESAMPGVSVSVSHEVNPVFREYERTCVTAFDAYLKPVMKKYLANLESELLSQGFRGHVSMMKSRGGLASIAGVIREPVATLLSGPAAGVVGAHAVASAAGIEDVITIDMGGTSADIGVIRSSRPLTSTSGRIERYPLSIPMVDLQTIGAGGGSVAWLDAAGGLRVGPQSAGADPGPAAYGRGGERATVTDAGVVLGYLDTKGFAGGVLDYERAEAAISGLADSLDVPLREAALGIHRIANAKMADAIRLASVKRGYDIRNFTLLAFGGAGPVHAALIAQDLGIERCLVPKGAGVLCALGLLLGNVEYDNAGAFLRPATPGALQEANHLLTQLVRAGDQQMKADGFDSAAYVVSFSADMRFTGQSSELEVALPPPPYKGDDAAEILERFIREHRRVYGHAPPNAAVEFVALRTAHVAPPSVPAAEILGEPSIGDGKNQSPIRERPCAFPQGMLTTPVFAGARLAPHFKVEGPAIIEESDTTIVVYPDYTGTIDTLGNVVLDRDTSGTSSSKGEGG